MSTTADIKRCTAAKSLFYFKPNLRPHQQLCRLIYITPTVATWIRTALRGARSDGVVPDAGTPQDQLIAVTRRFCSGEELKPPRPKMMAPEVDGIWRLRTADLRAVGWIPERGILVVSEIELKANCSGLRDNQMMESARALRRELQINGGAYLTGDFDDCV